MAGNYFVSPTGNDQNSGTSESQAWRTLAHLRGNVRAGDVVTLLPGSWRETLPLVSGLTVRTKEAGKSLIEGSSPATLTWTKGGDGLWRAPWQGTPPHGLFLGTYEKNGPYTCAYDGRYAQFDPSRPGGAVTPGSKAQWQPVSNGLVMTTISGGNPNGDGLVIATGDGAITLDGLSDVHLDGIVTRYWRYSVGSNGGRNIVLTNCTLSYAAQTSVWFTSIDGVELTGSRIVGGGSLQAHAEDCLHMDGGKAKIQNSELAWGGHGLAFCDRTGAFTFASNHLHDSGGSGITAARGVNDMRIEGNWIERCATQRSPSVRDVGAALQLHGDRHQIINNHLEANSKHVLLQAEGQANPSSSDCLFSRNTLLRAEETAVEYQENLPGGIIKGNRWENSIIDGAAKVDLLSCWWAVDKNRASSNTFLASQIAHGKIRGTLGTFDSVEAAKAANPSVYAGSSSSPVPGAGSSLTKPPTGGATPPDPPIPPPSGQKPLLVALTPAAGPPGVRVTATGTGFGVNPAVIYSNADGGKRLENLGGTDIAVSWTMPTDVVTGEVRVRRIDTTPTQLSDPLTFTKTGSTPTNKPPIANAGGPYSAKVGEDIIFNASGSSDPDGTITNWRWAFGDGQGATGASPSARHAYPAPGTYTVTLTVTDNQGATASASTTATIAAAPPPAEELAVSITAVANLKGATFSGVASERPVTLIINAYTPDGRKATAQATVAGDVEPPDPPPGDLPAEVAEVIRLTNQARAAGGLPALAMREIATAEEGEIGEPWIWTSPREEASLAEVAAAGPLEDQAQLRAAAKLFSEEMLRTGVFSHTGEGGSTPFTRMAAAGFRGQMMGENIARGYSNPDSVMTGWMNSSGHRANILNAGYRYLGVGIAGAGSGKVWVCDFGG